MKYTLITLLILSCSVVSMGQLDVTSATNVEPFTPTTIIENVLLGEGVEILSLTHSGRAESVGSFTNGATTLNMDAGIILSTGKTRDIAQNGSEFGTERLNTSNVDPDMNLLAENILPSGSNTSTFDLNVVTIEFIPTTDTLKFRYIWASEEYPEFNCSEFNDIFGFIISGPGYAGPYENGGENIAKVPGTDFPVAINTINNGTVSTDGDISFCTSPIGSTDFASLYVDNNGSSSHPVFDGYTIGLEAIAPVQPCQTYRIKMMVADLGDPDYDSGIFLEAGSFRTEALMPTVTTASVDNSIAEGCQAAVVSFTNARTIASDFDLGIEVSGSAVEGVDFVTLDPNDFIIPAGELTTNISIEGIEDNIDEGVEFVAISYNQSFCKRDTIYLSIRDHVLESKALPMDSIICKGESVDLDVSSPTAFPEPQVFTNTDALDIVPTNTTVFSPIEVSGVSAFSLNEQTIPTVCFSINHGWIDDLEIYLRSPNGTLVELTTDNGGGGDNYTNTCFTLSGTTSITDTGSSAPYTGSWLPEGDLTKLIGENPNGTWQLVLTDDSNSFNGTLIEWSITFPAIYDIYYDWISQNVSCQDCPMNTVSPTDTTLYKVELTDSYGCSIQDSIRVIPVDSLDAPTITCGTATENSVSFEWGGVNGAQGYEVNVDNTGWQSANGPLSHNVTGLGINTDVTISVRAIFDCGAKVATFTCRSSDCTPATLSVDNINMVNCQGGNDGSISIAAAGGTPPYSFTLDGLSNADGVFSNLSAGNYTVQFTDALACDNTLSFEITEPSVLSSSIAIDQEISCSNIQDGSLSINVQGGTEPYNYIWSNTANVASLTDLAAGTYRVTITDIGNCEHIDSITLTAPDELIASVFTSDIQCASANDGTAMASASGGTSPYSFQWDSNANNAVTENITDLAPGAYTVTVTDANNCTATAQASIVDIDPLSATITGTDPTCIAPNSGQANISVQGGAAPYDYLWNDMANSTTETATNLTSGQYIVTVTDANNCSLLDTILLSDPAPFTVSSSAEHNVCEGYNNGSITLTVTGASNPTFLWSNGMTDAQIANLASGEYCVTVTDDMECSSTLCETITEPAALSYEETITLAGCQGQNNGSISLNISGGVGPYQIQWEGLTSTDFLIEQLAAGNYAATITDANACEKEYTGTVSEETPFTAMLSGSDLSCNSSADGSVDISISNSVGALTYEWSGPNDYMSNTQNITGLEAGSYNVTIQDPATGCQHIDAISLSQPDELTVQSQGMDVVCHGESTGSINIQAQGGSAGYSYSVDGGNMFGDSGVVSGLEADSFYIVVRDANNCEAFDTVILSQPLEPVIVEAEDQHKIKFGESVTLTASTNVASAFIQGISWTPDEYLSCNDCLETVSTPELSTTYLVEVTDQDGCTGNKAISVIVDRNPTVLVANIFSPNGDNVNDYLTVVTDNVLVKSIDRFEIYDRWGSQVYLATNMPPDGSFQGWDGTFKGDELNPGVFVWAAMVTLIDGTQLQYTGDVTIVK